MRAELGLPSVRGDDEKGGGMMGGFGGSMGGVGAGKAKRPINFKFEIPYFTTSGIQVRYLKIIEPKVSAALALDARQPSTDDSPASIPVASMGAVHYSVRRHRSAIARCSLKKQQQAHGDRYTNETTMATRALSGYPVLAT